MCHIDKIHESVVINMTISILLAASDERNKFVTNNFSLWVWNERKYLNNQLHWTKKVAC
jgi:protein associated with RNAse G/E